MSRAKTISIMLKSIPINKIKMKKCEQRIIINTNGLYLESLPSKFIY